MNYRYSREPRRDFAIQFFELTRQQVPERMAAGLQR